MFVGKLRPQITSDPSWRPGWIFPCLGNPVSGQVRVRWKPCKRSGVSQVEKFLLSDRQVPTPATGQLIGRYTCLLQGICNAYINKPIYYRVYIILIYLLNPQCYDFTCIVDN